MRHTVPPHWLTEPPLGRVRGGRTRPQGHAAPSWLGEARATPTRSPCQPGEAQALGGGLSQNHPRYARLRGTAGPSEPSKPDERTRARRGRAHAAHAWAERRTPGEPGGRTRAGHVRERAVRARAEDGCCKPDAAGAHKHAGGVHVHTARGGPWPSGCHCYATTGVGPVRQDRTHPAHTLAEQDPAEPSPSQPDEARTRVADLSREVGATGNGLSMTGSYGPSRPDERTRARRSGRACCTVALRTLLLGRVRISQTRPTLVPNKPIPGGTGPRAESGSAGRGPRAGSGTEPEASALRAVAGVRPDHTDRASQTGARVPEEDARMLHMRRPAADRASRVSARVRSHACRARARASGARSS
jgi:hypothetical protein